MFKEKISFKIPRIWDLEKNVIRFFVYDFNNFGMRINQRCFDLESIFILDYIRINGIFSESAN